MEQLDNIDLCKGTFVAGDQLQMIFGEAWSTLYMMCSRNTPIPKTCP